MIVSGGGGAGDTVRLKAFVALCGGEDESVTRAINEKLPFWLGMPEIPPALESVNPAGSAPEERLQL